MERKSSTQCERFLTLTSRQLSGQNPEDSEFDFLSPNYSKFAVDATEIVRFLKYERNLGSRGKKLGFSEKKGEGGKFAVNVGCLFFAYIEHFFARKSKSF